MAASTSAQLTSPPTMLLACTRCGGKSDASTGSKFGTVVQVKPPVLPTLLPFLLKPVDDLRTGWDLDLVVSRPPFYKDHEGQSFCSMCIGVPRYPVMLSPHRKCQHVFCNQCAMQLIKQQAKADAPLDSVPRDVHARCPMCRVSFVSADLVDYDSWFPQMRVQWQEFRVRCVGVGCSYIASPDLMKKHEFDCILRKFECPCKGCTYAGTRPELTEHVSSCEHLRIYCDKCGTSYYRNGKGEIAKHDCLEELKAVAMMMKRELGKRGVFWPVAGTISFEPVSSGQVDFDSDYGTGAMLIRKALERHNNNNTTSGTALATSSPAPSSGTNVSTRATNGSANESFNGIGDAPLVEDAASMEEGYDETDADDDDGERSVHLQSAQSPPQAPIVLVDYNEQELVAAQSQSRS